MFYIVLRTYYLLTTECSSKSQKIEMKITYIQRRHKYNPVTYQNESHLIRNGERESDVCILNFITFWMEISRY